MGRVVITEYYDPATGRMTPDRDYSLASISTDVQARSVAGRKCLQASAGLPGHCVHWEQITRAEIDDLNHYPSVHDWVIMGNSEDGVLTIKVQSPSVHFSSANGRAGRGLGCSGTNLEMSNTNFSTHLASGRYQVTEHVGREFQGAPHCARGSTIDLDLKLCNPLPHAGLDHCGQIQALLEDLKLVMLLRDAFREMAPLADDDEHLVALVNEQISERYPGISLQNEAYLAEHAGGYDICAGKMQIADICGGCVPEPLCRWEKQGLEVHETVHHQDIQASPNTRKLFCDSLYQQTNYSDVLEMQRDQAQAWAELDYNAYNEQARYLRDIIQEQLGQSTGCTLNPQFYVDLDKALHAIEP